MSRAQEITQAMLQGDFSLVAAFSTRSGTVYRVFCPARGDSRPDGPSMVPDKAFLDRSGSVLMQGKVYGREGEGRRSDGRLAFADGSLCTTTPVQEVMLRTEALKALLQRPQAEVLGVLACLTSARGTVYPCISKSFDAIGTVERKFLPEQIFMYEGVLMVRGRVWGDSRFPRGEAVTLSRIDSVTLKDGSVLNARQRICPELPASKPSPIPMPS